MVRPLVGLSRFRAAGLIRVDEWVRRTCDAEPPLDFAQASLVDPRDEGELVAVVGVHDFAPFGGFLAASMMAMARSSAGRIGSIAALAAAMNSSCVSVPARAAATT